MWLALCGPPGTQCMAATSSVSKFFSWPSGAVQPPRWQLTKQHHLLRPRLLHCLLNLVINFCCADGTKQPQPGVLLHTQAPSWFTQCSASGFAGQCSCTHLEPCFFHVLLLCRGQCSHKEGPQGIAVPRGTVGPGAGSAASSRPVPPDKAGEEAGSFHVCERLCGGQSLICHCKEIFFRSVQIRNLLM